MFNFIKKGKSKDKICNKSINNFNDKRITYFDYMISNQNLIHFENLLINKLDSIKEKYEDKMNLTLFSLLLTIFGFSTDSIGFKIIKALKIFREIDVEIWVNYIIILLLSTFLLYKTIRIYKKLESLDAEFLKNPINQNKLLYRYIVNEHEDEIPIDTNDYDKFFEYYYCNRNRTVIKFRKNDFETYIYDYLHKKFKDKIEMDVNRYLSEVILLRNFLDHKINKLENDINDFEFILCEDNMISISMVLI